MPVANRVWGLGNKGHDDADVDTEGYDDDHAPTSPYDAASNVEYDQPCECTECSQVWSDNEEDNCQLYVDEDKVLDMRDEMYKMMSSDPALAPPRP